MAAEVQHAPAADLTQKIEALDLKGSSGETSVAASLRESPVSPRKTPFVDPLPDCKPLPAKELTPEQEAKYGEVLQTVKSWKEIPSSKGKEGPITDEEIFWLTRECILRYLRATKWHTNEAIKRLLGTLTWRREFGVSGLTADYISIENETGKQLILGYDNNGRPCQYLSPGRQNTETSHRQVDHLVYMLERVIDMMGPGQETLTLVINMASSKTRRNTSPPFGIAREVLHILQSHYPERLGKALVVNVPWLVNGFFKLITPFIDPMTREKVKFNEDLRTYIPASHLWKELGGDADFEYDHAPYWPALNGLCDERRRANYERWVKAGKHFGESEVYIKGGDVPSIGVQKTETAGVVAEQKDVVPEMETAKVAA